MSSVALQEAQRAACAKVGVVYRDVPIDGKWHPADIEGDNRGRGDARIILFEDGQGGYVHNWKENAGESFFADDGRQLNETERRERDNKRAEAMREAQKDAERQRTEAATKAEAIWKAASSVLPDHPYFMRKQVQPVATLRELPASEVAALLGYMPKSRGETLAGRLIIAPVKLGAKLSTLELIDEAGRKSALAGGQKGGGYWAAQKLPDSDGTGLHLLIAEGISTALSVKAATGHPVIAALSCGNLDAVARQMRAAYPKATIVICGDLGNGQSHAEAAARNAGALLALPQFGDDRPDSATDFNDMATLCGLESVAAVIASASMSNGTVWPDPRPLPPELHPVQPFDLALLPDSLRPWISDVCERVQCPADFVAVPVMVALGTLIGRKVRIRPKARDSWTVVPNVWGCIIGRPGTMKSPAVSEAMYPLRRLEAQAREAYDAAHADYETQAELAKLRREAAKDKARATLKKPGGEVSADALRVDQPDEPTLRRYTAHQSSVQALGELLRQNPNGLMVERDELAGLLSNLAQEEKAEDRGFYLTGADGVQGFTFDTIGRGLNLRVAAVCVSIIGTSQPGKIGRYLRQAQAGGEGDDGMMQRFGLMVWPDSPHEWRNVDRWPDSEARRCAFAIFERLDNSTAESVGAETDEECAFLRFAPDALEAFTEWRSQLETRLLSREWHPALESHFAKYRKTVPALALILHLADGGTGPVTLQATLRALAWADYLDSHALRCYGATVAGEIGAARRILARIKRGELLDGFKAREIDRAGWADLTDRDTVRAALALLVAHGYLIEVEISSTTVGGRPTLAYRIHPASVAV